MAKKAKKPTRRPPPTPLPVQVPRPRGPLHLALPKESLHFPADEEATHVPTPDAELTVKHSLEIVKTIVTATILEIIWIRRVFPEHKWQMYAWDPADPSVTYGSFAGRGTPIKKPNYELTENLMCWHFPKRGTTPGLDKLLDCLELGTHDALEKGYLQKLSLSLARVDDGPITQENLIESYTIHFSYGSGNVTSRLSSETRHTKCGGSGPVLLVDVKKGARALVDSVAAEIRNLSRGARPFVTPLPSSFRMVITMDFTEDTPSDYQPPRFHEGNEHASRLINLGDVQESFSFTTSHHSVAISLCLPGDGTQQSTQTHQSTEKCDLGPSQPSRYARNPTTPSVSSRQKSMLSELEGGHTHPEAMRQFGRMGAFREPNTETQDTRPLHRSSQASRRAFVERRRSSQTQSRPKCPPYTQRILDNLPSQDDVDAFASFECDCGVEDETQDKLFCLNCKSFHHPQCYGYFDGRHPKCILCYKCLLQPDGEEELFHEMRRLCIKRRILTCLLEAHSPLPIRRINEYSCGAPEQLEDTEMFLAELQQEGFVRVATELLQDKDSMAIYTLVANEDMVRSNYFRPDYKISHHFAVPETPSSLRMNEDLSLYDPDDHERLSLTALNPSDAQSIAQAAQRLLPADASSTQDTSSHPSLSRRNSRTFSSTGSPQRVQAITPEVRRSSSNMKRTADPHVDGRSHKRRYPAMNSPLIFGSNARE